MPALWYSVPPGIAFTAALSVLRGTMQITRTSCYQAQDSAIFGQHHQQTGDWHPTSALFPRLEFQALPLTAQFWQAEDWYAAQDAEQIFDLFLTFQPSG